MKDNVRANTFAQLLFGFPRNALGGIVRNVFACGEKRLAFESMGKAEGSISLVYGVFGTQRVGSSSSPTLPSCECGPAELST